MFPPLPENTICAARAIYGKGNVYIRLGDDLNKLISEFDPDVLAVPLYGYTVALLAVVTIIQYIEELTDNELAESLHQRIDLRYALHLPFPGPLFDPLSLCMFRQKVLDDKEYHTLLTELFRKLSAELGNHRFDQSPNMTTVVRSVCENSLQASVVDAMFHCIEALSANHFNWLRKIALPHWYERYGHSPLIVDSGTSMRQREFTANDLRADIRYLLQESSRSGSLKIDQTQELKILRRMWVQMSNYKSEHQCVYCFNNHFEKGGEPSIQQIKA